MHATKGKVYLYVAAWKRGIRELPATAQFCLPLCPGKRRVNVPKSAETSASPLKFEVNPSHATNVQHGNEM